MACPLAHLNPAFQRHDCDATLRSITEETRPLTVAPLPCPLTILSGSSSATVRERVLFCAIGVPQRMARILFTSY